MAVLATWIWTGLFELPSDRRHLDGDGRHLGGGDRLGRVDVSAADSSRPGIAAADVLFVDRPRRLPRPRLARWPRQAAGAPRPAPRPTARPNCSSARCCGASADSPEARQALEKLARSDSGARGGRRSPANWPGSTRPPARPAPPRSSSRFTASPPAARRSRREPHEIAEKVHFRRVPAGRCQTFRRPTLLESLDGFGVRFAPHSGAGGDCRNGTPALPTVSGRELARRTFAHVRAIHRPCPQGDAAGQPGGPAVQPRIHRHRARPARPDQGGQRRRGQRPQEPRHRPAEDPHGGREARPERPRHGHDGQAPADAPGQEGDRVFDGGGPQPQPQLRRHRAHPAGPAPRAGGRGRPGADEPRPEARGRPRGGAQPARPRHGGRGRAGRDGRPAAGRRRRRRRRGEPQGGQEQDARPSTASAATSPSWPGRASSTR